MVTPESDSNKVSAEVIAEYIVRAFQRTMPPAVADVVFLSGGQSEEEATLILNAMNQLKEKKSWSLSFFFGRALQQGILKAWSWKENVEKAQGDSWLGARPTLKLPLGTYKGDGAS